MPTNLTESQTVAIIHASRPLQPEERSAFLAGLTAWLADRTEIGDGELGRALRDLQHEHFKAPTAAEVRPESSRSLGSWP